MEYITKKLVVKVFLEWVNMLSKRDERLCKGWNKAEVGMEVLCLFKLGHFIVV